MTPELPALAVMLEPGSAELFGLARSARGVCRLVFVADLADPGMAAERRALDRFGAVVDLHGRRGDDVVAELRGLGVRGITALTDAPLPYAAAIAEHLSLPFHSREVARLCTDKAAQRARFVEAGVPSAASVVVPRGSSPPTGLPVPAVVKPRRGTGSRAVSYAADEAAVRAAVTAAGEDVVVEEFLPDLTPRGEQRHRADLVSAEVVVRDGEPTVLAVSQQWPLADSLCETGSCFPAGLDPEVEDAVGEVALAAVRALGIRHGFQHVELKRTPTGPRLVELNGRMGGKLARLSDLAGGTDVRRLAYLLALGLPLDPLPPPPRVGYLHWVHAPAGATRVVTVEGLDEVRAMPGVEEVRLNVPPGGRLCTARGDDDHVVAVEGSAPDHASAFAMRTAILAAVRVSAG